MRGRTLSLLLVVLLSLPVVAGATTIDRFNEIDPFSTVVPPICFEPVFVEGSIHLLGSTTFSKGGNFRCSFHFNLQNVTGYGEFSNDPYSLSSTGNISLAGSLKNGSSRFNATFNGTLTDLLTGDSSSVHVNVQFTANAKGDVTAQVLNIEFICPF